MKKVLFIVFALGTALFLIAPEFDLYAYFVNLCTNIENPLSVFDNFVKSWNYMLDVFNNFNNYDFVEAIKYILIFIYQFLIGLPLDIITWLINFVVLLFGGVI